MGYLDQIPVTLANVWCGIVAFLSIYLMLLKMTDEQVIQYVRATAVAMGLPSDEERVSRAAAHFKRTQSMAQLLDQMEFPDDLEIPEIYCPKPV